MSVRYKFKNEKSDSTLLIDGFHISVRDLKRGIVEARKLGRVTDFDLIVEDSNTIKRDDESIPKNSSVVVQRIPLDKGKKMTWYEEEKVFNNSGYYYFISSLSTTILNNLLFFYCKSHNLYITITVHVLLRNYTASYYLSKFIVY